MTHSSAESSDYSGVLIGSDLFLFSVLLKKKKIHKDALYCVAYVVCRHTDPRWTLWVTVSTLSKEAFT